MGASNYLALESELEQTGKSVAEEMPWRHGLATFAAFGSVGAAPLLAYYLPRPGGMGIFTAALLLAFLTLLWRRLGSRPVCSPARLAELRGGAGHRLTRQRRRLWHRLGRGVAHPLTIALDGERPGADSLNLQ
jgi:hypothetical protein